VSEAEEEQEDLLSLFKINGEQAGAQGSKEKKNDTANKTTIDETSAPALELFVKPGSSEATETYGTGTEQRNAVTAAPQLDGLATAQQQSGDHTRLAGSRELPAAGASQHAPVRAADPAAPFEQAVTIIRDNNRLAVRLEPDGLGKLDMDLRLHKGVVTAQIQVADDATKTLFERNAQQIVDALVREGISVGGFTVSLKDGNAWQGYAENEHNPGAAKQAEAIKQTSAAAAAPHLGRVSLFA
jgi:flagellar hook-length control protein FliK